VLLDSPRANAVLQTESLDQHAAWSTPSPLGEARLVYRGLSDVPPQGSPSERLDATEGCLWKETRKRGHRPPRCAFWALIPSPLLWRIWLPYFASHHEDDCQPQNDSPAGVLRMYAHEWVLGSPSCSWLWERCDARFSQAPQMRSEIPHGAMFMGTCIEKVMILQVLVLLQMPPPSPMLTYATLLRQYPCAIVYRDLWRRQRSATFYRSSQDGYHNTWLMLTA